MALAEEFIISSTISVIVTCYNHEKYLTKSIESVLSQNCENLEIIVVDDGSTDDTKTVVSGYSGVKYIYQSNQGLSAARNTGIDHSSGQYLVFLDADDWLLEDALAVNLEYLKQMPEIAFVSSGHLRLNAKTGDAYNTTIAVEENHYCRLLERNYIQMHGAVMYRRRVFDTLRYDSFVNECADYDVYLKIARNHPVFHHPKPTAVYRLHDQNMSGNAAAMLEAALTVLNRQQDLVDSNEKEWLRKGLSFAKKFYCEIIYDKLLYRRGDYKENETFLLDTFWKYHKLLYLRYLLLKRLPVMTIKTFIKNNAPRFVLRAFHKTGIYKGVYPYPGRINLGDLNRTTPFGTQFGYNRGGSVDRYYIENFLEKQAHYVKGKVLEVDDNEYTLRFGGAKIEKSEILHVDDTNPKATIVADLSDAPQIPDNSFDCIILTQTLHIIYPFKETLETCYRILKPGGALLLTVPGISHIDHHEWKNNWMWSFTDNSIKKLLSEIFPDEKVSVETYGNVLVATAFLYGIGLPEMKKEQMDFTDPHYQVIISAVAVKPDNV